MPPVSPPMLSLINVDEKIMSHSCNHESYIGLCILFLHLNNIITYPPLRSTSPNHSWRAGDIRYIPLGTNRLGSILYPLLGGHMVATLREYSPKTLSFKIFYAELYALSLLSYPIKFQETYISDWGDARICSLFLPIIQYRKFPSSVYLVRISPIYHEFSRLAKS